DMGPGIDTSSFAALADSVLPPANFDKDNAYYRMWTLTEPPETDIESEETLLKYRRMHDPKFDNMKYLDEWAADYKNWGTKGKYNGYFKPLMDKRKKLLKNTTSFDSFSGDGTGEWTRALLKYKAEFHQLKELYGVFLERYRVMMDSEIYVDFTLPDYKASIPNLLAWLQNGRLHNADCMMDALENANWEPAVSRLLDNVNFTKKVIRNSRTLILNLVAKAIMRESVHALAALMNEPGFPKALYKVVSAGLPPISVDETSAWRPMSLEGYQLLHSCEEGGLLQQTNRTNQYYCDFIAALISRDKTPPYKWDRDAMNPAQKTGPAWWLQNAEGKKQFDAFLNSKTSKGLATASHKGWSLRAAYDMTCIAAEIHHNYAPGKPVAEMLKGLDIYKKRLDPCSGKPYIWNEQKHILYSIGTDGDDDGGKFTFTSMDTDFALPVVPYIKGS
ncbi:MAG: hypothetical protein GY765_12655, partial [bacterium]|nr:hypothetical protein [bacterium]